MNIKLRAVPTAINGSRRTGSADTRHGLRQLVHQASHRLAVRRAGSMAEQHNEQVWFWRLVKLEVERARRHEGSFTVLCLRDSDVRNLNDAAERLRPLLRSTDAVAVEGDRILILLGETGGDAAGLVAHRLAEHVDPHADHTDWHEVEFPRHALTVGALVECLTRPETGDRLLLTG